ncbi:alpha/beta hydrolase [Arthrobacter sp. AK01]|uniref:alpha/beta fold hydrolase n=1 Tax=Arthrobacter sp. AK01 TaxID=2894084 RepID=UPI001E48A2E0|nr:alpha/beta hydrolase [Arthrobacter sp. AK01]MCD4853716.1 alpha/beta hydrolase [Arthrobacter sp. AK01]
MHSVEFGAGTPVLVIHGFCVDHRLLLGLDPVFDAHGQWRRVYVDLPGMGQTAAGPEIDSTDAVANAVVSFTRETFGDAEFAILGNSFGGMIARHLVAEFGDQVLGVALLCPVVLADHGSRAVPQRTVIRTNPALMATLDPLDAADYEAMSVVQSPGNWSRFRDAALPGLRIFDPAAIERISKNYALREEPEGRFAAFQGPTLILAGRQDHVVGFQDQIALANSYPQSTIVVLDQAGHNAHLDQPVLTAALVKDWLTRVKAWKKSSNVSKT